MLVKKIIFDYPKLFKNTQEIEFDKNFLCFVGENGSGKTTVLRIIEKIFRGRNHGYGFSLNKVSYSVDMELDKDEYNLFFNNLEYSPTNALLSISNIDNGYKYSISSKGLVKEYDLIKSNVEKLADEYNKRFLKYYNLYLEFAQSVPFEYDRRPLLLGPERLNQICFINMFNNKDKYISENGTLIGGASARTEIYVGNSNSLHQNFSRSGRINEEYGDFFEYFKEHIKTATPIIDDVIKKFRNDNKILENEILQILNLIDEQGQNFNKIFASWQGINSFIEKKLLRQVVFLSASNDPSDGVEDFLYKSIIQLKSNDYYDDIFSGYKEKISINDYDEQLLHSLFLLKALEGSEVSEDEFDSKTAIKYIEENKNEVLQRTEEAIFRRNIHNDISKGFPDLIYEISQEIVIKDLREYILKSIPPFDELYVDDVTIEFQDNRPKIYLHEKGIEQPISLEDTSTGRNWGLIFKTLLSSISENGIFIIDEPAAFLHLSAQRDIVKEMYNQNNMIIYTTHTPTLLPSSLDESGLYSIKIKDEDREISRIQSEYANNLSEIFSLNFAKYLIIKRFSKVLILSTKERDLFFTKLRKYNIVNDLEVISTYDDKKAVKRVVHFLESIQMEYYIVLSYKKVTELKEMYGNKIFSINELKGYMKENSYKKVSDLVRGETL